MGAIVGEFMTYRLVFERNADWKASTLYTVSGRAGRRGRDDLVIKQAGFLLDAGLTLKCNQRKNLEPLCCCIMRPATAESRLPLANNGNIVIALKTPYDDGNIHLVQSRAEIMGRLAALVPRQRVNLTGAPSSGLMWSPQSTAN